MAKHKAQSADTMYAYNRRIEKSRAKHEHKYRDHCPKCYPQYHIPRHAKERQVIV